MTPKKKEKETRALQMTKCTIRLPWDLMRAGKIRAMDEHRNYQDIVADALRMYLASPPRKDRTS